MGLRPIENLDYPLSAQKSNSLNHAINQTHQQTSADYSKSLNTQSSTILTLSFSTICEPYQKLQTPLPSTLNDIPPPSNSLKRKVLEKELEVFAKCLRIVARGPETVYFNPKTIALIPQSNLEYFIIKESQRAKDEARNGKSFFHTLSEICSHYNTKSNSTTYTAKEAGLIMPPPSP